MKILIKSQIENGFASRLDSLTRRYNLSILETSTDGDNHIYLVQLDPDEEVLADFIKDAQLGYKYPIWFSQVE